MPLESCLPRDCKRGRVSSSSVVFCSVLCADNGHLVCSVVHWSKLQQYGYEDTPTCVRYYDPSLATMCAGGFSSSYPGDGGWIYFDVFVVIFIFVCPCMGTLIWPSLYFERTSMICTTGGPSCRHMGVTACALTCPWGLTWVIALSFTIMEGQ